MSPQIFICYCRTAENISAVRPRVPRDPADYDPAKARAASMALEVLIAGISVFGGGYGRPC